MGPIWQKALRADILRTIPTSLAAVGLVFLVSLCDLHTWPLHIHRPTASDLAVSAAISAVVVICLVCVIVLQKRPAPERHVSPLLALSSGERRRATTDLKTAHPSDNPSLRHIETLRAQQLVVTAPTSMRAVGIVLVTYAAVCALMFVSGSPLLGVLWVIVTCVNVWAKFRTYQRGQAARRYLKTLGLPTDAHVTP